MSETYSDVKISAWELAKLVKNNSKQQRFCFILGAGASKESGIATGVEMAREWGRYLESSSDSKIMKRVRRFKNKYKITDLSQVTSEHYFEIYELRWHRDETGAYKYLQKSIENASPSYGYYPLAMLLTYADGINSFGNNLVITTNFDNLTERMLNSCSKKNPLVVGHETLAQFIDWEGDRPIVAKLHRDQLLHPRSSRKDTNKLANQWERMLRDAFHIYTPIVVGYAGGDKSLMSFLKDKSAYFPNGLYWCKRKGDELTDEVMNLVQTKKGHFVEIYGFDSLMFLIGIEFGFNIPAVHIYENLTNYANKLSEDYAMRRQKLVFELKPAGSSEIEATALTDMLTNEDENLRAELDDLVEKSPYLALYRTTRGSYYHTTGDYQSAIEDYTKAIELSPYEPYVYYIRAITFDEQKNYDLAIADYTKAIELDSYGAYAYYYRGVAYGELGEYDLAIADYTKAIGLDSNHVNSYFNRGIIYHNLNNNELAIADYTMVIKLNPSGATSYYNRGIAFGELGEYDLALADYTMAIRIDPKDAAYYYNRGFAYSKLEEYVLAVDDYSKAIDLDPGYFKSHFNRGFSYGKLKNHDLAIIDFSNAIKIDPNDATTYYNRGFAYCELEKYDLAEADCTKAIDLDPCCIGAYANRVIVHIRSGHLNLALEDSNIIIDIHPDCEAYNMRGYIYLKMEKYDFAIADLTYSISLNSNCERAYQNRADVYDALGQNDLASIDRAKANEIANLN